MKKQYPILEFDHDKKAMIEPHYAAKPIPDIPERAVICFFQEVIDHFRSENLLQEITSLKSEIGSHPIYKYSFADQDICIYHPGVGAPFATAMLEEVISLGCRKFIVCGGAGVLDSSLATGRLIVPVSAVRDEGTSYHYLPPGREVRPSEKALQAVISVLKKRQIDFIETKTWTTDSIYRETKAKVKLRRSEGCLAVEMEAAALFAAARFRGVELAQILYSGDNLDAEKWDGRGWQDNRPVREKLTVLAAECCLEI